VVLLALMLNALTTYATAKAELGLSDDTQQPVVERLINSASRAIQNAAYGRIFQHQSGISELVKGTGGFRLVVKRTPLRNVIAINLLNPDGTITYTYDPTTYTVENVSGGLIYRTSGAYGLTAGYSVGAGSAYGRMMGWPWLAQPGDDIRGSPQATTERPALQVVYDGGWITPWQDVCLGSSTPNPPYTSTPAGLRDLPYDLEEACLMTVTTLWRRRGTNRDVISETVDHGQVTYRQSPQEGGILPPEAYQIAQTYRRVF
jgi:hypothetical protein